jgi:hypothetical protein
VLRGFDYCLACLHRQGSDHCSRLHWNIDGSMPDAEASSSALHQACVIEAVAAVHSGERLGTSDAARSAMSACTHCPAESRFMDPTNGFTRLFATGRQTKEDRPCVKQSWVQQVH